MELNRVEWAGMRRVLKELECRYEGSECGMMVHVEVYCTSDIAEIINTAVDNL